MDSRIELGFTFVNASAGLQSERIKPMFRSLCGGVSL